MKLGTKLRRVTSHEIFNTHVYAKLECGHEKRMGRVLDHKKFRLCDGFILFWPSWRAKCPECK